MGDNSNLTSVVVLNPDCNIMDNAYTFYGYSDVDAAYFSGTIYGYSGSTAEEYAEKYGRNFFTLINGDVDMNGNIDALDASEILSYYSYTATGGKLSFDEWMVS